MVVTDEATISTTACLSPSLMLTVLFPPLWTVIKNDNFLYKIKISISHQFIVKFFHLL